MISKIANLLAAAALLMSVEGIAGQHTPPQAMEQPIENYRIDTAEHPLRQLLDSQALWEANDRELSAYVYFVGQIRYRTYLMANPDLSKDRDLALHGSLTDQGDYRIFEWVRGLGTQAGLLDIIDQALRWHTENDDQLTPKSNNAQAHKVVHDGLIALRSHYATMQIER